MAKSKKRIDTDRQQNLFDLLQRLQDTASAPTTDEGSLNIGEQLRLSVSHGIKQCTLSRYEIAGQMSHLVGEDVTKPMIASWTAESKNGHRIPAEYVPAFCVATKWTEPVRILSESAGLFSLPGPDALRVEIQKLEEDARRISLEKKKRVLFLHEMEGK